MPDKKRILPIAAGLVLLAALWLAFRDNSATDPAPSPARAARPVATAAAASERMPRVRVVGMEIDGGPSGVRRDG